MVVSGCLLIGLTSSWLLGTCYDSLQYKGNFCHIDRTYMCQQLPKVILEFHGELMSPSAAFPKIHDMLTSFYMASMSGFTPMKYMDSDARSLTFLFFYDYYTFESSPVNVQYNLISSGTLFLLSGQPLMMCSLYHCAQSSLAVSCYIYYTVTHIGMSVAVCITLMFIFIPRMSSSLCSLWFCHDSQTATNRSGSGL